MHVYNLVFEDEAFLYKLFRHITVTLVHIAKGQMTIQDVLGRFSCPPDDYDSSLSTTQKPNVLFLYEVKYNEQDFLNPPMLKNDNSIVDNIDNIMMEVQDDDDENDQQLNSRMIFARL
jgi:tRNA U38,U39,U40 pseudouridine synthase TruA